MHSTHVQQNPQAMKMLNEVLDSNRFASLRSAAKAYKTLPAPLPFISFERSAWHCRQYCARMLLATDIPCPP
jgi:hypothetical protein